jgi:streptogramin lyase
MRITGLPFVTENTAALYHAAIIGYLETISLTASNIATGFVEPNTTDIRIFQYPTGGGGSTAVPIDTSGAIIFSLTYIAA